MRKPLTTNFGKGLQAVTKLRGSGQALPGLVIEKLSPHYFRHMLAQLPDGVVVITGTNGKTTTTKMVVSLLESHGKKVVTNKTGSNLTRGIISSLIQQADRSGHLPYDIAVLEIDEAFAKQFVKQVKPQWVVGLNVSRDQLDRFGEVDVIADLIGTTMHAATVGVVTNANDPRLVAIAQSLHVPVKYFGIASSLRHFFPTDNELVSVDSGDNVDVSAIQIAPTVELTDFKDQAATYKVGSKHYQTSLQLTGQHNFQNAAAAVALTSSLLPEVKIGTLIDSLATITTAFGRGESFNLADGSILQLVLVKNPASFRQTIASYLGEPRQTMFVINDNYADSRDVSWLWDVDFAPLQNTKLAITSGSRAADMALRLQYADIEVTSIEPDIDQALRQFAKLPGNKVIVATYTAMLYLYDKLSKGALA